MTRTVRLTIWPDRVLTISEAEYHDLTHQGLILEDVAPEPTPEPAPVAEAPASEPRKPRRGSSPE